MPIREIRRHDPPLGGERCHCDNDTERSEVEARSRHCDCDHDEGVGSRKYVIASGAKQKNHPPIGGWPLTIACHIEKK